jgi:hypothetical protein
MNKAIWWWMCVTEEEGSILGENEARLRAILRTKNDTKRKRRKGAR